MAGAVLVRGRSSTPKALKLYGIEENTYSGETQMMDLVHQMRTRIVSSPSFGGNRIVGAILFEATMDRDFGGKPAADYLWNAASSSSLGSGQTMPASRQRRRHSCTVERALPIAAAICRSPNPSALSRNASRILRTGNLACPTVDLLGPRQIDHGSGGSPASHQLARHAPEWWPGMDRNPGPACAGIAARHGPELWPGISRNTHGSAVQAMCDDKLEAIATEWIA